MQTGVLDHYDWEIKSSGTNANRDIGRWQWTGAADALQGSFGFNG